MSTALEMSGQLPTRPAPGHVALYRFFDADGALLYVGICDEPVKRWYSHADKWWWPQVERFHVLWLPSRNEALARETEAIRTEKPLHNVVFNGVPYSGRQFPGARMYEMARERFGDTPFTAKDLERELGCPRGSAMVHARRLQREGLFVEAGRWKQRDSLSPRERTHFRAVAPPPDPEVTTPVH